MSDSKRIKLNTSIVYFAGMVVASQPHGKVLVRWSNNKECLLNVGDAAFNQTDNRMIRVIDDIGTIEIVGESEKFKSFSFPTIDEVLSNCPKSAKDLVYGFARHVIGSNYGWH